MLLTQGLNCSSKEFLWSSAKLKSHLPELAVISPHTGFCNIVEQLLHDRILICLPVEAYYEEWHV